MTQATVISQICWIGLLNLSFFCGFAAGFQEDSTKRSQASESLIPQEPEENEPSEFEEKDLSALMLEHVKVLEQQLNLSKNALQFGSISIDEVLKTEQELLRARLEMATDETESVSICEKQLRNAEEIENFEKRRFEALSATENAYLGAKAERLKFQIQLLRKTHEGETKELRDLLVEREQVLERIVKQNIKQLEVGLMRLKHVVRDEEELLYAKLDVATDKETRVLICEDQIKNAEKIEQFVMKRLDVREATSQDVALAQILKLNFQIQLQREKSK